MPTTNNLTKSYGANLCANSNSKYLDIRNISACRYWQQKIRGLEL